MPRGIKSEGSVKSVDERRMERLAKRQEAQVLKMNGTGPDELFEKQAKAAQKEAKEIVKAIQEWYYGEAEAGDMLAALGVSYRSLTNHLTNLAATHKTMTGK